MDINRMIRRADRELCTWILRRSSLSKKIEHYQRRYDGQILRSLLLPPVVEELRESCVLVDYAGRRTYGLADICRFLEVFDTVSFDLFDTLLFRDTTSPAGIFNLVGQELGIPNFQCTRIAAEQAARKRKFQTDGTYEVTLVEIYSMLPSSACGGMEEELRQERRHCHIDVAMWQLVESLYQKGKQVVITSDMYLTAEQLAGLLRHAGYTFPGKLYVSNQYGCSKADGRLFSLVQKDCGAIRLVHIGDNFASDILMSRQAGIPAVHCLQP